MKKPIPITIGISSAIVLAILVVFGSSEPSQHKGAVDIVDSVKIEIPTTDMVITTDSANSSRPGLDYTINSEGKKNYVLSATDSPDVSD